MVFTVAAWRQVEARELGSDAGRPVCGLDIGSSRSWSAAVLMWPSGRTHALLLAPGVPDLAGQERRDAMPEGVYRRLVAAGVLDVDEGLRVVQARRLVDRVMTFKPRLIIGDEFRRPAVLDAVAGRCRVLVRRRRWSDATEDIGAARRGGLDGLMSVTPESSRAFRMSLMETEVVGDDDGNIKLVKRRRGRSRDDLCSAFVAAAGALARQPVDRPFKMTIVSRGA